MIEEDVAIDALQQVKNVLDNHGIEYWLDQGTLLGAVREGKVIQYDDDIDLGTWSEDADRIKIACRELQRIGDEVYFNKYEFIIKREGCNLDIHLFNLKNGKATTKWMFGVNSIGYFLKYHFWMSSLPPLENEVSSKKLRAKSIKQKLLKIVSLLPFPIKKKPLKIALLVSKGIGFRCITLIVPCNYFINLSTIKFYGMEFRVPAETEEYLTYKYGEDWRIPNKYWSFEDDGAILK